MFKQLKIAAGGHHLADEKGNPFFYLGDTAWELFHRLDLNEAEIYLKDRARKGFTVIQAVLLAELGGLTEPGPSGALPLIDQDPTRPNPDYFRHVDAIVDKATKLGLAMGLLPTWGRYWSNFDFAIDGHGAKPIFTAENARHYGAFLGQRYRDKPIIWILGGDRNATSDQEKMIIEAMAAGLKEGDQGSHLITYHPMGPGRSASLFPVASWLDFHMYQSSHAARDHDNGLYAMLDRKQKPTKPTLDGEPRYETIPVGFYWQGSDPKDRFDDSDCRQAAYGSVLAGACGHTYGNNNVWQMWTPQHEPVIGANTPWHEALDHPGAYQMKHFKDLFTRWSFAKLCPDQGALILDAPRVGGAKVRGGTAVDRSFALVYSPQGKPFTMDPQQLASPRIWQAWFDPRYGRTYPIHVGFCQAPQTYQPPTQGRGQDWVLIVATENEAKARQEIT